MAVKDEQAGKTADERANIKATALHGTITAAVKGNKKYSFRMADGRTVTVEDVQLGIYDPKAKLVLPRTDGGAYAIWLRIAVDGTHLNGDGWYGFVNPPILIRNEDGSTREDLILATKTIVAEAVGGSV